MTRTSSSHISNGTSPKPSGLPKRGDGDKTAKNSHAQNKPNPRNRAGNNPSLFNVKPVSPCCLRAHPNRLSAERLFEIIRQKGCAWRLAWVRMLACSFAPLSVLAVLPGYTLQPKRYCLGVWPNLSPIVKWSAAMYSGSFPNIEARHSGLYIEKQPSRKAGAQGRQTFGASVRGDDMDCRFARFKVAVDG